VSISDEIIADIIRKNIERLQRRVEKRSKMLADTHRELLANEAHVYRIAANNMALRERAECIERQLENTLTAQSQARALLATYVEDQP